MAPPMMPAATPGTHPPRQACAGEAVATARVATAARAINIFFMAFTFLDLPNAKPGNMILRYTGKFHIPLECSMNGPGQFRGQFWPRHIAFVRCTSELER